MLFACDEHTFFDTYEMIKYTLVPELQKMSCRRGLYKICSVLGTPTTAWTLAPESSALSWHPPQLTPNLLVWISGLGIEPLDHVEVEWEATP